MYFTTIGVGITYCGVGLRTHYIVANMYFKYLRRREKRLTAVAAGRRQRIIANIDTVLSIYAAYIACGVNHTIQNLTS